MSRVHRFFAVWFIVQIVLPFTAPLQACDLADLLGTPHHQTASTPESTSIPTTEDAPTFISPLEASTLSAVTAIVCACDVSMHSPSVSSPSAPAAQSQPTVLRL